VCLRPLELYVTGVSQFARRLSRLPPRSCGEFHGQLRTDSSEAQNRKENNDLIKYLMVGIGGFLGSVLRFWLGSFIGGRLGARFPYGTFVINVTGSFLIGVVVTVLATKAHWSSNWRYLIPIGFIGGYTTFSTFEYETFRLFQDGQLLVAMLNVTLSVVVGFIGVWVGAMAGRAIP
jgi:fluoride exporter